MTDLRTAAQQALEALAIGQDAAHEVAQTYHEAMAGYRPARHIAVDDDVRKIEDAITALRAALAEPVQEPVAWVYTGIKQDGTEHGPHLVWKPAYMDAMSASKGAQATPLYTAPPQRPAEPVQEPQCNPHPKAPHGFLRNASHTEDRYVCECEGWEPYEAGYQAGMEAALRAQS